VKARGMAPPRYTLHLLAYAGAMPCWRNEVEHEYLTRDAAVAHATRIMRAGGTVQIRLGGKPWAAGGDAKAVGAAHDRELAYYDAAGKLVRR
jgi:hypothetical protein